MQAVILAGGFGTRLRSLVSDVPKPMADIAGKPFLAYLLDYLQLQGFTRVVLSVHFMYDVIQNYFGDSYQNLQIAYAIEEQPLGTGGAIVNALRHLDPTQPLFVLNGDTFLKINYKALYQSHLANRAELTMVLRRVDDCSRYGVVIVKENCVVDFQERGSVQSGFINAGVYVLQSALLQRYSFPKNFSMEKDFLFPHVSAIKPRPFIVDDYFIDIGVPDDYQRAMVELPAL